MRKEHEIQSMMIAEAVKVSSKWNYNIRLLGDIYLLSTMDMTI